MPLHLGGSNEESNLKLVPTNKWKAYTATENVLGKALKEGRITKEEAQTLIVRFKKGEVTAARIKEKYGR